MSVLLPQILPAFSLMQLGTGLSCLQEQYGVKTAHYAHDLLGFQVRQAQAGWSACPEFRVPQAFGVPVGASPHDAELHRVYRSLAEASSVISQSHRGVLMARSSGVPGVETPGANPTLMSAFDLQRATGFDRFRANVHELLQRHGMGVLLTHAVGGVRQVSICIDKPGGFYDEVDKEVFGADNVSFCADTHGLRSHEATMAFVNGLGHRVVGFDDAIIIFADRETQQVKAVINLTDHALRDMCGSQNCPKNFNKYRQQKAAVFDMEQGVMLSDVELEDIIPTMSGEDDFKQDAFGTAFLLCGLRLFALGEEGWTGYTRHIGRMPFLSGSLPMGLLHLLQGIGERCGGVQIEGAYRSPRDPVPFIYQWLPIPTSPYRLSVDFKGGGTVHAHTNDVIGAMTYQGPLMLVGKESNSFEELQARQVVAVVDKSLAGRGGYVVLAESDVHGIITALTRHARARLFTGAINVTSHEATDARLSWLRDPSQGVLLGSQITFADDPVTIEIQSRLSRDRRVSMHGQAKIVSDGEKLVVQFFPD